MNRIETGLGITRRYLHDEVAERLRTLIQNGELEPRARLNEMELACRFGISRTPLREAIKILATEGLLELLPNRGARVASLSEAEIDEVLEVVAGLEATAAELACRAIGEAELAEIEAAHRAMVEAARRGDHAASALFNRRIHEMIVAASRNATLVSLYESLSGRIQTARYVAHATPEQRQSALADHERMLVLLRARDGEALSRLLRSHVRGKKAVVMAAYAAGAS
ncbi:GntR family transcriptional regulator [Methylobacterium nodulans]|uniref:Transcriptional regulator, GntR family n=1 Tax=Methylobacterium nodulans (strain LMG 21967 / CNCM I-2342 / ORS 2060) TaxID=460265 RepID=B8IM32_METNO|nr:GntR family transcriptional regulator [Methylobacterium nodulans]ACL56376.1 transcriptional regulator, GntR family [Methylobacterium nodulans ORS 2060]